MERPSRKYCVKMMMFEMFVLCVVFMCVLMHYVEVMCCGKNQPIARPPVGRAAPRERREVAQPNTDFMIVNPTTV